jgi:hypothetical protein
MFTLFLITNQLLKVEMCCFLLFMLVLDFHAMNVYTFVSESRSYQCISKQECGIINLCNLTFFQFRFHVRNIFMYLCRMQNERGRGCSLSMNISMLILHIETFCF